MDAFDAAFSESPKVQKADAFEAAFPVEQVKVQKPIQKDSLARQAGLTARYAIEGATSLPSLVADAVSSVPSVNSLITGKPDLRPEMSSSQAVSNLLTQLGLPTPQNPMERVVGDVSRGLVGTGGSIAAGNKLIGMAEPLLQKVGTAMASNPLAQGISAMTGTGASSVTREAGGSPMQQAFAGLVGALTPAAVMAGARSMNKPVELTGEEVKNLSREGYKMASERGGILKPEFTDKILDKIDELKPQHEMGQLMAKNDPVVSLSEALVAKRGKPITLDEAHEFDKRLGDLISGLHRTSPEDARRIYDIQSTFRNMIEDAAETDVVGGKEGFEALKEARKLWSVGSKMEDLQNILTRASQTDNPATAIKTGFRNLYNNPSRMRGYSDAEKQLIFKASKTGVPTELLKMAGSRLNTIAAAAGGGIPSAAAAQGIGMASRAGATKLQSAPALRAINEVAKSAKATALYKNSLMESAFENGLLNRGSFLGDVGKTYAPIGVIETNRLLNPEINE